MAPADTECHDVLRYVFNDVEDVSGARAKRSCRPQTDLSLHGQIQMWERTVTSISLPTYYDPRQSSTTVTKGTKGCISMNIVHRVFIGQSFDTLLESSAPEDPELDPDEDVSSNSDAGEISDEGETEMEIFGPLPSRKDAATYKAFLRCEINYRHTVDARLQSMLASGATLLQVPQIYQ